MLVDSDNMPFRGGLVDGPLVNGIQQTVDTEEWKHTKKLTLLASTLQRNEFQEKLSHVFRLFDTSCDGYIDVEELRWLLSRMHVPTSEPELVVLFYKMDG